MPPPATIYGHICSAVGEFLDPAPLRFAYTFWCDGIGDDLELLHIATVKRGRWPSPGGPVMNLEVSTNPTPREVLVHPRMTLYVTVADVELLRSLERAFREPRYVVTLGRSQDLMAYRTVDLLDLEEATDAYFEATLLPWRLRTRTADGIGVTMPRFIDPRDRRRVTWSPFVMLEDMIWTADSEQDQSPRTGTLARAEGEERWWVDPTAPPVRGRKRGVVWHGFTNDDPEELVFIAAPTTSLG
jgi:CRISPR-associated protein Cas5t